MNGQIYYGLGMVTALLLAITGCYQSTTSSEQPQKNTSPTSSGQTAGGFDPKTKTIYIPDSTKGKFDWHKQDYRNWFVGGGHNFLVADNEIVWYTKSHGGLGSWLAFDKNKDITWSADCKTVTPDGIDTDCGIVFYPHEAYYARLLLEVSHEDKQPTKKGDIFLLTHFLGHIQPQDARQYNFDISNNRNGQWVNLKFEYKAYLKELRLYWDDKLALVLKDWNAKNQPHPVMHLYNWVVDARSEFFVKNIRITEGDLCCWSLSPTRMSGSLAGQQIMTENLRQEAPADAPGAWFLTENASTGTLTTPFIRLSPGRSFKTIRLCSRTVPNNNEVNDLRLFVLDENNQFIPDKELKGNSAGFDVASGIWEMDISALTKRKTLRFRLTFTRYSPKVRSPEIFWLDLDTAQIKE